MFERSSCINTASTEAGFAVITGFWCGAAVRLPCGLSGISLFGLLRDLKYASHSCRILTYRLSFSVNSFSLWQNTFMNLTSAAVCTQWFLVFQHVSVRIDMSVTVIMLTFMMSEKLEKTISKLSVLDYIVTAFEINFWIST